MPDLKDLENLKDKAADALEKVSENKQANAAFEKAADAVEKKTNIDIPSAAELAKKLDK